MSRTPLFSRQQPGGVFDYANVENTPGNIWFVDSTASAATNGAGYGRNPDAPFATLRYCVDSAGLAAGDTVFIMPGHTESFLTAVDVDVAGVKYIGLGKGASRPTFTVTGTVDGLNVTAASVVLDNFVWATPSAAHTSNINIAATDCVVRNMTMTAGANFRYGITVTAAGERPLIEYCEVTVTANGPVAFIDFEGVIDRPIVRYNNIIGSDGTNEFDNGCIDFSGVAVTNPVVVYNNFAGQDDLTPLTAIGDAASVVGDCYSSNFYSGGTTNADTVATVTATIGAGAITAASFGAGAIDAAAIAANAIGAAEIANGAIDAATFAAGAIDAAAIAAAAIDADAIATGAIDADAIAADTILGADNNNNAFASTNVVANADGSIIERLEYVQTGVYGPAGAFNPFLGYHVTKTQDMGSDPDELFDVTGKVAITLLTGEVTTVIGGAATLQLLIKTSGEALCAVTTIDNDADGTMYLLSGDAGDTLNGGEVPTTNIATANGKGPNVLVLGTAGGTLTVNADLDAGDTGAIRWDLYYWPLEANAAVVASA